MNILFVTIAWPEQGRNLYTDLMHEFKDKGHDVTVLCNREGRVNKPDSIDIENNISVIRINSGNIKKAGILEKGVSLLKLSWKFRKGVKKYLPDAKFDLIIFNTPPVTLSGFLKYLKNKFNCPLYLLLKDMWPYGFADHGLIKRNGWIYNYLQSHEDSVFKLADWIGCMSPKGVEFVLSNYQQLEKQKVEVCPNSMKIDNLQEPIKSDNVDEKVRERFGIPKEATVFIFSGNLGLGHGLDFLVESILKLKDYRKAFFLIGGAGTHFSKIKEKMDTENPPNAYMYSYLPEKEFQMLMSICDVGLILLDNKYSYPQFPSRLLGYLERKMAVLCAVNKETDLGDIVEKHNAGMNTIHGNMDNFTQAIKRLSENRDLIREMGQNGYSLLQNRYDVKQSYKIIMNHFN